MSTNPARFMAYPLVLLSGVVMGGTFLSAHSPFQAAQAAGTEDPPEKKKEAELRGRLGAESPELRDLRLAEAELFPERDDREISSPELWDEAFSSEDGVQNPLAPKLGRGLGLRDFEGPDFLKGLKSPGIPIRRHPSIAKYIRYFTTSNKGRKLMATWLARSGRYRKIIGEQLRRAELPSDLEALVFIESGFWPTARSSAGAVGLWQFMPKTGRAYGLIVDKSMDERRSIWRASEAATQHISDLYDRFHSWELTLAAYNLGYKSLTRRMAELGTEDFWTLSEIDGALPRETALYVPKVMAVAVILNNLKHFGLDEVEQAPPIEAAEIRVPPGIRFSLIARACGTSVRKLRELNPEFRVDATPDRGGPVVVHIPAAGMGRARVMLPRLLQETGEDPLDMKVSPDFDWGSQEMDGDNKSRLERTAPDSAESPVEDFSKPGLPRHNQKTKKPEKQSFDLVLPHSSFDSGSQGIDLSKVLAQTPTAPVAPGSGVDATRISYRVQLGDTIWSLAEVYGVPRSRIIRMNSLDNPNVLSVGKVLVLDIPPMRDKQPPEGEVAPAASSGNESQETAQLSDAGGVELASR